MSGVPLCICSKTSRFISSSLNSCTDRTAIRDNTDQAGTFAPVGSPDRDMAAAFAGKLSSDKEIIVEILLIQSMTIIHTGHQVLQIELLFLFAFAAQAHGSATEQNGSD